ncbi:T-complex-associated testis-expressed protein 1, partial [Entophlyctis luteolus]
MIASEHTDTKAASAPPALVVPDAEDAFAGLNAKERRMAQRRCIAEDKDWNLANVERLSELCLRVIVKHFDRAYRFLPAIPQRYRARVLDAISVSLPLAIAAPLIPDDAYWQRRTKTHFKLSDTSNGADGVAGFGGGLLGVAPKSIMGCSDGGESTAVGGGAESALPELPQKAAALLGGVAVSLEDVWMGFGGARGSGGGAVADATPAVATALAVAAATTRHGSVAPGATLKARPPPPPAVNAGKWKTRFFELHIQNIIEAVSPKKVGGIDEIAELQKELRLATPFMRKLDIRQLKPVEVMEGEDVKYTDPPADHLDFSIILNELIYLKELKIYYGVRDCGINFSWRLFGMTLNDCLSLSNSIKTVLCLEVLVIQASGIDDDKARLLASALLENRTIQKLDLSHNKIGDSGARGIAKVLASKTSILTHLDLSNNCIQRIGAHALGKALQVNSSLIHLNLRMNRLGDAGGADFCACLAKVVALTKPFTKTFPVPEPSPEPHPVAAAEDTAISEVVEDVVNKTDDTQIDGNNSAETQLNENQEPQEASTIEKETEQENALFLVQPPFTDIPAPPTVVPILPRSPVTYLPLKLCSLDMASNGLGIETVHALCALLKKKGKNLKMLDFSCNKLGDCGNAKAPAATNILSQTAQKAGISGTRHNDKSDIDAAGKLLFEAVSQNK